ncbi:F-box only protein 39 [Melanerpes formicivorus]|uniref:F-box only protein 39 n=1 Tax=Melanerpes formicivorus TaxID=211600 RepID=UPI00358FF310
MDDNSDPEQSSWAHLPDVCLRNIFYWLDDRDRSQAALVCVKWSQVMHSACLWRSRRITFLSRPSRAHVAEVRRALFYAKKFGRYLEHLEIKLPNPYSTAFTQKFQVVMRDLLSHLGKCSHQLVSLSIRYLELDRYFWRGVARAQMVKHLAIFLKRMSKHLESLDLKGARTTTEDGCELLNSLSCVTSRSIICKLNIEDFFSHHLHVYRSSLFHQTMSKFQGLVILSLNYSCLSDELLDTLQEHSARSLRTLNIKCHVSEPHGQAVWGMSWAKLAKSAPKLTVNFVCERILKHDHLARMLLVDIPVRSISLRSCYSNDPEWLMRPTLTSLLPAYRHVLEKLTLELNNDCELLDEELLQLTLACRRLSYLKVWAFLSVTFLERLLQSRAEGKCSLTTIKVKIYTAEQDTTEKDQLLGDIYRKFKYLIDSELNYFATTYTVQ